jgi:hypothetical protein
MCARRRRWSVPVSTQLYVRAQPSESVTRGENRDLEAELETVPDFGSTF